MKKVIIGILIVLLVAGCNPKNNNGLDLGFKEITGTKSLEINFMKNYPPKEVYEEDIFEVILELENAGAYNIEKGYLTIGYEKDMINFIDWPVRDPIKELTDKNRVEFSLKGIDGISNQKSGEKGITNIKLQSNKLRENQEIYPTNIYFTSCYDYSTRVSKNICIDTSQTGMTIGHKACEPKDISLSSQGAPISIKKISYKSLSSIDQNKITPIITIEIYNSEEGIVLKNEDKILEDACSAKGIDRDNKDWIIVYAKLSNKELNCGNNNIIKLTDDKAIIVCRLEEGLTIDGGSFLSPLTIELSYGYSYSVSQEILINRLTKY